MTVRELRLGVFLAILAVLTLGPFYRQVLHGTCPHARNWVMYRRVGYGLVQVAFARRLRDGRTAPVDRLAVLGDAEDVWRITGRAGFATITQRLCAQLGPGLDLRAQAREATHEGWATLATGERNLCATPATSQAHS